MTALPAVPVPAHVLRPGASCDYNGADSTTKSAGLGYAILRALGARESMSEAALQVVAKWSAKFGADHADVTPHPRHLKGQTFAERLGPKCGAPNAAANAACYPGGDRGQPSYAEVYRAVWVEQRWPELCAALASS